MWKIKKVCFLCVFVVVYSLCKGCIKNWLKIFTFPLRFVNVVFFRVWMLFIFEFFFLNIANTHLFIYISSLINNNRFSMQDLRFSFFPLSFSIAFFFLFYVLIFNFPIIFSLYLVLLWCPGTDLSDYYFLLIYITSNSRLLLMFSCAYLIWFCSVTFVFFFFVLLNFPK